MTPNQPTNQSGRWNRVTRRDFCQASAAVIAWGAAKVGPARVSAADRPAEFRLNYILASPMYGTAPLAEVLPEVAKIDANAIDIWPRVHANHREQVEALGHERFLEMLDAHKVRLGIITRYDLGPWRLQEEIPTVKKLGGRVIVCGAGRGEGDTAKQRVARFVEKMTPQVALAEEHGVTIGIENHASTLLHTPDAIHHFADLAGSPHLGLAMAPYHLPQDPKIIAELIEHLGDHLVHFQAWEHGKGCAKKLPKEEEMLQMPARGPLDFEPILRALKEINYAGWTEIFMHPVPRGIPIRPTVAEVTTEINHSRTYLEGCLRRIAERV